MNLTITLPAITATWEQVTPDDTSLYLHSWDLNAIEVPAQVYSVLGFSSSIQDCRLIAWIDQLNPAKGKSGFHVNIPGLSGDAEVMPFGTFATLEDAQAAVHKALGVTQ